jgi:hypothetical protein
VQDCGETETGLTILRPDAFLVAGVGVRLGIVPEVFLGVLTAPGSEVL